MSPAILDTDMLMPLFKGMSKVTERAQQHRDLYGYLNITIITYYEVMKGHQYVGAHERQKIFDEFCRLNNVIVLDQSACKQAAQVYADLRRRGKLIPDADILIAGIALAGGYTLVTQNVRHFQRITGLKVENWLS
ncbi:MAG: type II toxin-antitoxin system VapC family toxin [Anaerolineales bacterium]|nr:type II toxin-antitoxin system VapC family toxin [Anaerolineales bacterium]